MGLFGSSEERQMRRAARRARKEDFRLRKMGLRSERQKTRQENLGKILPSVMPVVDKLVGGGSGGGDQEGGAMPPPSPMKAGIPILLGLVLLGTLMKKKSGF